MACDPTGANLFGALQFIKQISESSLSGTTVKTLLKIASHGVWSGNVNVGSFVGIKAISAATGVSESTVKRSIRAGREAGFLSVRRDDETGCNHYTVFATPTDQETPRKARVEPPPAPTPEQGKKPGNVSIPHTEEPKMKDDDLRPRRAHSGPAAEQWVDHLIRQYCEAAKQGYKFQTGQSLTTELLELSNMDESSRVELFEYVEDRLVEMAARDKILPLHRAISFIKRDLRKLAEKKRSRFRKSASDEIADELVDDGGEFYC